MLKRKQFFFHKLSDFGVSKCLLLYSIFLHCYCNFEIFFDVFIPKSTFKRLWIEPRYVSGRRVRGEHIKRQACSFFGERP